ncbi:hypothetical protein CERZMDRAFT_90360 [Cercospora zeae-maydis SCOH1-5]|uniref:Uncharacterized protein n=1 Tax=Cercospora zeae-maydis SCOH1-5 TaxID=717836 RepID=A0A6A6FK39_9PEZI|nr:hypothetical protein CERZMDRAFT_90360 [Cercospora zeae-maydis SCOH1-5]
MSSACSRSPAPVSVSKNGLEQNDSDMRAPSRRLSVPMVHAGSELRGIFPKQSSLHTPALPRGERIMRSFSRVQDVILLCSTRKRMQLQSHRQ